MFKYSVVLIIIVSLCMWGCASREGYYNAITTQNMTQQLQIEKVERQLAYDKELKEIRRQAHQERMAELMHALIIGVSKTATPTDDVMAPILFLMMEDKWALAELIDAGNDKQIDIAPIQTIEPPADGVDYLKAAAPWAGYALAGFGIYQVSKSMTDLAATAGNQYLLSGENNKMNVDSFKSGSNNAVVAGGDSSITGGDTIEGCESGECEEEEEGGGTDPLGSCGPGSFESDGEWWTQIPGCSCSSCGLGHCGDTTIDCPNL